MSTRSQDKEFNEVMQSEVEISFTGSALDTAIQYIGKEFSPDEVFDERKLTEWAQSMTVDSIFPEKELQEWAEANGYVKE